MPSITQRILSALNLGPLTRSGDVSKMLPQVSPAYYYGRMSRDHLTLGSVFRAVQVLTTAVSQLSLDAYRNNLPAPVQPSLLRQPDVEKSRSDFLAETVTGLALDGNAFWLKTFGPDGSTVINLEVLPPSEVSIDKEDGKRVYRYGGDTYRNRDVLHLKFLPIPGKKRGLGPIAAARAELDGASELRDFASNWFASAGVPSGVLKTDQHLNSEQIEAWKTAWNESADGGVRVLGNGLTYATTTINPKDAQFIESRQFSITEVARIMGVPQSLMLAPVEGTSTTYQNVEQEWIGFTRFTLMAYLRPIEEAFSTLTPSTQNVRFNLEGLLRSDTKSRYESYEIGIRAGFLTPAEVRGIEGLPPAAPVAAHPAESETEPVHE